MTARPGYIRLLRRAIADGHEVAQHGLSHDRFEVGIPPAMILELPHEAENRRRLIEERDAIMKDLQVEPIRQRLAQGRLILREALAADILGFRAPALQWCDALPQALRAEGYRYDSSRYLQATGWNLIRGELDTLAQPITREHFLAVQPAGGPVELPLTTDYTWYLTRERYAPTWRLARHDIRACHDAGIPLVTLSHVAPMLEGDPECGLRLLRALIAETRALTAATGEPLPIAPLSSAAAVLDAQRGSAQ
jgi:peptidoglycan/xylan/chitin deacetylase (PgdA/CDA1 family)